MCHVCFPALRARVHKHLPVQWLRSVQCKMYKSKQVAAMHIFSVLPRTTGKEVEKKGEPPLSTKQELRRRLLEKIRKGTK